MTKATLMAILVATVTSACAGESPVAPTSSLGVSDGSIGSNPLGAPAASSSWTSVSWEIPAGRCPLLSSTVTGSGDSHLMLHLAPLDDGRLEFRLTNNARGTARDASGTEYVFNYTATARGTTAGTPPNVFVPPFDIHIADHFNLVGAGKSVRIIVGFVVHVALDASGNFTFDLKQERGQPAGCDGL